VERRLDVDESVRGKHELDLRSAREEAMTDDTSQLRQEDAQPRVIVRRRVLAIDGDEQLFAADPPAPIEREVGEEQASVGAGQGVLDALPTEAHDEPAAELNLRRVRFCRRSQPPKMILAP
jgi:hypothetical protein